MSRWNFSRLVTAFAVLLLTLSVVPNAMAGTGMGAPAPIFDFNKDLKSDLLLNKVMAPNVGLLQTQLIDGFSLDGSGFATILPAGYRPAGAGNFSGNGRADILARKTTAPNAGLLRVYELNAAGTAVVGSTFPTVVSPEFSLLGIGDLDGNGKDDLAYVKTSGTNLGLVRVYLFSDSGDRSIMSTGFPTFVPTGFDGVGLADVDGNGLSDIVTQKQGAPNAGLVRVFLTAPGGLTVASSTFPTITPAGYQLTALGVFDQNTSADFLLEKVSAPNVGLLRLQLVSAGGTGISGNAFPAILQPGFEVVGAGDYDGVNQSDIAARNTQSASFGVIQIFLLNALGQSVSSTGFPSAPSTAYEVVVVGPVIP